MGEPDALVHPADLFQIIHRAAGKAFAAIIDFVARFGEMRMQPAIVPVRHRGGFNHQLRDTLNGAQGASATCVIAPSLRS